MSEKYSINNLFHYILHFDKDKKLVGFWNLNENKQKALLKYAKYLLKETEKGNYSQRYINNLNCIINTYEFIMKPDFKDKPLTLVSKKGRIITLYKYNRKKGTYKIKSGSLTCQGYKTIYINGNTKRIHRIVVLSFHPNLTQEEFVKLIVDHLDKIKYHNFLYNLEPVTTAENNRRDKKGQPNINGKSLSIPIIGINLDTKEKKYFKSTCDAEKQLKIDRGSISLIIRGIGKKRLQKSTDHWWKFCIDESKIVRVLPGEKWEQAVIWTYDEKTKKWNKTKTNAEISDLGRFKTFKGIPYYPYHNKNGYRSGRINKKSYGIHSLVLWAFIGHPPTPKHTPDHEDKNPLNNKKTNLKWATKKQQNLNRNYPKTLKNGEDPIPGEYWTLARIPKVVKKQ